MKSLLWKQFVELRASLLAMIGCGIGFVPMLKYLNSFETGSLVFLLFCLAGPLLALMIGTMLFKYEFEEETINFLDTLPIPRQRIWLTKILSGLVMVGLLYVAYILIGFTTLNEPVNWSRPLGIEEPRFALPLLILAPLFFFSYGVVSSLVPMWASTLLMLGLMGLTFLVMASHLYLRVNFTMAIPLLTLALLMSSRFAFTRGEMKDPMGRLYRVMSSALVGLAMIIGIWIGLDNYAGKNLLGNPSRGVAVPVMADGSLLLMTSGESAWYDPIREPNMTQIVRFDPKTGSRIALGPRLAMDPLVDRTGTRVAFSTAYSWPGIVGLGFSHTDRGIKPHNTLLFYDPAVSPTPRSIDEFAFPIGFSSANTLLYYRYRQPITEVCELVSGTLSRVESNIIASFVSEPRMILYDPHLDMVFAPVAREGKVTVIDCRTRKMTVIPNLWVSRPGQPFGAKTAFSMPGASDSWEIATVDAQGAMEKPAWVLRDTKIVGNDLHGLPIGIVPAGVASGPWKMRPFTLSRFDPEKATVVPIIELGSHESASGVLSPSGKTCFVTVFSLAPGTQNFAVDLTESSPVLIKLPKVSGGDQFQVLNDDVLLIQNVVWKSGKAIASRLLKYNWRQNSTETLL